MVTMSETTDPNVLRTAVEVDGRAASYLTVDRDGPNGLAFSPRVGGVGSGSGGVG
jgi:hypothetical protein